MQKNVRVLIVDDEPALRDVLLVRMQSWGYRCRAAADAREAESLLELFEPDLVLTDVMMPGTSGIELLRAIKAGPHRRVKVVLMTAHGTINAAVAAMKEGAEDFLTKPVNHDDLRAVLEMVESDLQRGREIRAVEKRLDGKEGLGGLVGESEPMRELYRSIAVVASSDASALITGESGTGKEVVARAIHDLGARRAGPFVALNAAAIPENLVESELFGHEKGAFTGAVRARAGAFEQAHGGTLFLDELAEMPVSLQPKLLRILEDGRVRRLGATREASVDVRVLAATNRPPTLAIEEGKLREDLFYRLNVFELHIPPLRERVEDVELLCQHFIRVFNEKHRTEVVGPRESALDLLRRHAWPGNVRELRNVIERSVIVARERWLEPAHLPPYIRATHGAGPAVVVLPVGTSAAEAERRLILKTLEHVGNNKAEAARRLGLDVKTVRNKLRGFGEPDEE